MNGKMSLRRAALRRAAFRRMALLTAVVVIVALIAGCATGRGSTFSSTVAAEKNKNASASESTSTPGGGPTKGTPTASSPGPTKAEPVGPTPAPKHPVKTTTVSDNGGSMAIETSSSSGIQIEITSSPSNAEVYVNGQFQGYTPLTMENPGAGAYDIQIVKTGYYSVYRRIDISANTSVSLDATLAPVTGYLYVEANPSDAQVFVDGRREHDSVIELPIGMHRVRIARFAYTDYRETVDIRPRETTTVSATLEKAAFSVSDISVSRARFNPNNPGPLGTSVIGFRVTSYGSATVTITHAAGGADQAPRTVQGPDTVATFSIPSFNDWQQQVTWQGTDQSGHTVPDGEYAVTVTAHSSEGGPVQELTATITVDSSLAVRYRATLSGASGLVYAPIPDTLPDGSMQVGTQFLGHVGTDSTGAVVGRFPLGLGLRYGLPYGLEVLLTGQGYLNTDPSLNDGSVTLGARWNFASMRFGSVAGIDASVTARTTFLSTAVTDTLTNFDGFSISAPLSVHVGPIGLSLTPEVMASTYPVYPVSASPNAGVYLWGYGRAGLYFDTPTILIGLSTAVRTIPFVAPSGTSVPTSATIPSGTTVQTGWIQFPLEFGLEGHVMLPGTSLVVSLTATADVSGPADYAVYAGGGVAFLY